MKTVAAALALLSLLAGAAAQNATAATVGAAAGGDEYVTVADPNTDPILRAACIQAFDGQCAECDLEMDPPTCMACVDPHAVWSPSQFKCIAPYACLDNPACNACMTLTYPPDPALCTDCVLNYNLVPWAEGGYSDAGTCVYYEACRQTDLACDTCDPVNPNRCTACHNSTTHTLFDGACVAVDACRARDLNCDGPCDTVNPNQCNSLACKEGTEWEPSTDPLGVGQCVVPLFCQDEHCMPRGCPLALESCEQCEHGYTPVLGRCVTCAERDPHCAECDGTGQCLSCTDPSYIVDETTGACRPKTCTERDEHCCGCDDSDYCIRCSNPDWVVGSTGRCVPPPPTGQCSYDMHSWCKRCNSGGRCTRCAKRNHVLDRRNGRCRPAQCRERHPRCSLCSYGGACLRCQRGWFWSKKTHKCVAVPRTHLKRRWTCRTLDPNCARCMRNAPLQCKECRAGYGKFWRGSKCMNAGWFQRWRKQHG